MQKVDGAVAMHAAEIETAGRRMSGPVRDQRRDANDEQARQQCLRQPNQNQGEGIPVRAAPSGHEHSGERPRCNGDARRPPSEAPKRARLSISDIANENCKDPVQAPEKPELRNDDQTDSIREECQDNANVSLNGDCQHFGDEDAPPSDKGRGNEGPEKAVMQLDKDASFDDDKYTDVNVSLDDESQIFDDRDASVQSSDKGRHQNVQEQIARQGKENLSSDDEKYLDDMNSQHSEDENMPVHLSRKTWNRDIQEETVRQVDNTISSDDNDDESSDHSNNSLDADAKRRLVEKWRARPHGQYPVDCESDLDDSLVDPDEILVAPPRPQKARASWSRKNKKSAQRKERTQALSSSGESVLSSSDEEGNDDAARVKSTRARRADRNRKKIQIVDPPRPHLDLSGDSSENADDSKRILVREKKIKSQKRHKIQFGPPSRTKLASKPAPRKRATKVAREALLVDSVKVTLNEPVQWNIKKESEDEDDLDNFLGALAEQAVSRRGKASIQYDEEILAAAVAAGPPRLHSYENATLDESDSSDDEADNNLVVLPPTARPNALEKRKSLKQDLQARVVHKKVSHHYTMNDDSRECEIEEKTNLVDSFDVGPTDVIPTSPAEKDAAQEDLGGQMSSSSDEDMIPVATRIKRHMAQALADSEAEESEADGNAAATAEETDQEEHDDEEMRAFLSSKTRGADVSNIRELNNQLAKEEEMNRPYTVFSEDEARDGFETLDGTSGTAKRGLSVSCPVPIICPSDDDKLTSSKACREETDDEEVEARREKAKRLWNARRKRELESSLGVDSDSEQEKENVQKFCRVDTGRKLAKHIPRSRFDRSQNRVGLQIWSGKPDQVSSAIGGDNSNSEFRPLGGQRGGFASFQKAPTGRQGTPSVTLPAVPQAVMMRTKKSKTSVPGSFEGLFTALNSRCSRAS